MVNMRKVGGFISYLRKQRDLTQAELANKLSVTHQAISKWERGESLPDIGIMVQLAKFFGLRVDDVLKGEVEEQENSNMQELVEGLGEESLQHEGEMIHTDEVEIYDLVNDAPIVKASAGEELRSHHADSHTLIQANDVVALAPFVDKASLNALIDCSESTSWTWRNVSGVGPFVDRDVLAQLIDRQSAVTGVDALNPHQIMSLAPFLGRGDLERIIGERDLQNWDWRDITGLAPFVGRTTLSPMVEGAARSTLPSIRSLIGLAPFVDRELLERLVDTVIDTEPGEDDGSSGAEGAEKVRVGESLDWNQLGRLAPFIGRSTLRRLVEKHMDNQAVDAHTLARLSPFLGKEELAALIQLLLQGRA